MRVWLGDDSAPAGSLKETSSNGFRLFSTREVTPGDRLEFRCDSPDGERPAVTGTVVCIWSRCRYKGRIWDAGFALEDTSSGSWPDIVRLTANSEAQAA